MDVTSEELFHPIKVRVMTALTAAWFPCEHPDEIRIAQSVAVVRQNWATLGSVFSTLLLGLFLLLQGGTDPFSFAAWLWIAVMGVLAIFSAFSWQKLRNRAPPVRVKAARIHRLTLFAALVGFVYAAGMLAWPPGRAPVTAALLIAVAMTHVSFCVAAFSFLPWSVMAFSAPMFGASIYLAVVALPTLGVQISMLCIPMHMVCTAYCLRRNWEYFTRWVKTDVDKTRLMQMIREQKEMAETSVHRKTRFLASASHDLRQPMHAISLYLGGLAEMELPTRARRAVEDARECAHDLTDMLRSLLDISRLDAQQAVPSLSVFSMGTLLSRVEKEFAPLAHSRNVRLRVRPCAHFVYSDPVMVERIAMNFVSNAVRHTPGGKVLVACRRHGESVRLCVWDTGKGIPAGEFQAIFDEFYRAETAPPDQSGGLGLGLAIVKRLAQTLRANVDVRSKEGRGSMFAVDLPLMHVAVPARPQPAGADPLAGKFVVLVDDEVPILQAATLILEQSGCEVAAARSGRAVLELLAKSSRVPDAIICDYELKDEWKGPAVIRALRDEFNSEIPAMLVTGDTSGEVERIAEGLRVPVLYKPLESATLRSSLCTLMIEGRAEM